jgi:hypothetical protein
MSLGEKTTEEIRRDLLELALRHLRQSLVMPQPADQAARHYANFWAITEGLK